MGFQQTISFFNKFVIVTEQSSPILFPKKHIHMLVVPTVLTNNFILGIICVHNQFNWSIKLACLSEQQVLIWSAFHTKGLIFSIMRKKVTVKL